MTLLPAQMADLLEESESRKSFSRLLETYYMPLEAWYLQYPLRKLLPSDCDENGCLRNREVPGRNTVTSLL